MARRRTNYINDLFRMMAKSASNLNRGKLDISPCGYWFSDAGYTNPQGVTFAAHADVNGDMVSLRKRRTVTNCPEPPVGVNAPEIRKGRFQVPNTVCMKCPHRLPAGCCSRLIELRRADVEKSLNG